MSSSAFSFPTILAKLAKVFVVKQTGLISYGANNLLPNEIMNGVAASGTATNCVSKIDAFIQADGFSDVNFHNKKANPEQTWAQMLPEITRSIGIIEGVYYNIQINLLGMPADIYIFPVDEIRKTKSGSFLIKDKWEDDSIRKAIEYPAFNNNDTPQERLEIISKQMKANNGRQLGFIYHAYRKKPGIIGYSVPDFYSDFEDIESDASLQVLEKRNITKGFKTDVVISMVGKADRVIKDDNNKTAYDYLVDGFKKFLGPEGASILLLEGGTEAAMPTVTPFPLKDLLNGIDRTRARVSEKVCDAFGVPQILVLGEKNNGFGDTKALINSMKLFSRMILRYQNMITESINYIYGEEKVNATLTTLNLADYIDPLLFPDLTSDERRAIAGFDPLPTTGQTNVKSLAEILGTGSTAALQAVVIDPVMDKKSKVQFLIVIFGLTEVNANKLIYGSEIAPII